MSDVEMKDESVSNVTDNIVREIEEHFSFLNKAATNFDNRYVSKVFRELGALRRKLSKNKDVLPIIINKVYPSGDVRRKYLLVAIDAADDRTEEDKADLQQVALPEVGLYVHLLTQVSLLDNGKLKELNSLNDHIIRLMTAYNRRSLDFIQAKIWFYIARTKELIDDNYSIRPALLAALRTGTLRHDVETTASVITLLLRNYLLCHDVTQAYNLIEKAEFPENAGSALVARYYYYLAKVNATQLDYSSAHEYVIAAIRKAPQTELANGFIQSTTKLSIVIELLMGDIPELKVFRQQPVVYDAYFLVTKAVRTGDIKMFNSVLSKYESAFKKDDLYTLVSRLRQNVIKTGIRIISLSYSRISLKDICIKLHLDSEESTEYVVAKAIRDGVIEATINHEKGYMKSKELLDIYSTKLPQTEFDSRIKFCLSLHTDSVKSMRYPSSDNKDELTRNNIESMEDEIDLLKAIEEGDLDDFMD